MLNSYDTSQPKNCSIYKFYKNTITVQGYPRPALEEIADQRQLIELRTQDAYDLQVKTTSEHDECKTFSLGKNNFEQKIQF